MRGRTDTRNVQALWSRLWKDTKGDLVFGTIIVLIIMMVMGILCGEYIKVHGVYDHVEMGINRAANLAIKTAMYDSYRQDYANQFDPAAASSSFYEYLGECVDLSGSKYSVSISSVDIS